MVHVFYMDLMLTSAISQRDADSRWRHFIMLCNIHPADQTKLGSEWMELLTSPSGYSFPYAANELYSRKIFQRLVTNTRHKDPLYVPPVEQIPVICDADDCTNTCTSECMCGEVWCSRECMKKDWGGGHPVNGHQHICKTIFDNGGSLAALLTRMEMMKYLPAIDYARSFGVNPKPKPQKTTQQQNFTVQEETYRQMVQELLFENDEEKSPERHALFKKLLTKPPGKVLVKPPSRNMTRYRHATKDTIFALITRTPNITKAAALCTTWQEPLALGTVVGKQEACRIVATAVLMDEKGCSALHRSDLDSLYAAGKEVIQEVSSSADQKADAHVALGFTGVLMKVKRPHSESIEHFTKAIGFRPSSARQLELRAAFLAGSNEYNLALNDLRKVVELLADDQNKMLNVYHSISKCLFELDRNEDGTQALRKFLRCNPETGADLSWKRFEYTFTATDPDAIRFCEGMYELAFEELRNHKGSSCAQHWLDRAVEFESVNSGVEKGVADFDLRHLLPMILVDMEECYKEYDSTAGGSSSTDTSATAAAATAAAAAAAGKEDTTMQQSGVSKAVDVTLEEVQPKCQTTDRGRAAASGGGGGGKRSIPRTPVTKSIDQTSCNLCGKTEITLLTCSRCHVAKYCSAECQKRDWKVGKEFVDWSIRPRQTHCPIRTFTTHKSQCKIILQEKDSIVAYTRASSEASSADGRGDTKAARSPEYLDTPQETWVKGSWTKALCWSCGKRGKFKCVGCWMGRYCNKTCQKEGWRHDGHKAECDGLGKRKTKRREAKKLARAERAADQQMASRGSGSGGPESQPL